MQTSRQICSRLRRGSPGSQGTEKGFVLLEALVAMFLFSLGIMGIMGMQATMTTAQTESRLRSEAAFLAQELVGMMWTDIPNRNNYELDSKAGNDCTAPACLSWLSKVQSVMPQGEAVVDVQDLVSGDVGSDVVITVNWRMPNGDQHRFQTNTTIALSHTP